MINFGAACAAFRPLMVSRALFFTRSRAAAEDLVQDAMLRALDAWPRYKPDPTAPEEDAFRAWMYRILTNLAITESRRVARQMRLLEEHHVDARASSMAGSMALDERRPDAQTADGQEVEQVLARLTPTHREIVQRTAAGQSSAEVGAAMKRSAVSVRKALLQLRRQLCADGTV